MQTMSDSLGAYLKRKREGRQVSLQDMARATHISEAWIQALEENRFDSFSQIEYVPGYLKLYSAHLGLDYEEVMNRAREAFARIPARPQGPYRLSPFPSDHAPLRPVGKSGNGRSQRSDRIIKQAALAVFTILTISLFFFLPSEYKGPDTIHSKVSNQIEPTGINPAIQSAVPAGGAIASPPVVPLPATASPEGQTAVKPAQVIGNSDSKRYHLPGMKYYDQVQAYHRVVFASEEEAIQAGYQKAPR